MKPLLKRVYEKERALVIASILGVIFAGACVLLTAIDETEILGINRWYKPIKFFLSASAFLFTTGVFISYLETKNPLKNWIAYGTVTAMTVELVLIVMQALRGTTSHFNITNPFDAGVYGVMGIMISINTLLIVLLLVLYFIYDADMNIVLKWGIRLGIFVFLLGSAQGGYMASQPGHTVGGADGGAGLWFLSWSTEFGDLRVAHFLGLHALQIVPIFAWVSTNIFSSVRVSLLAVFGFALTYLGFFVFVFLQSLNGIPYPQGVMSWIL